MALNVGDAVLKITGDNKDLDNALKNTDKQVKSSTDSWSKNMKMAGAAMVAVGTAIVAALTFATMAAAKEEKGIKRLEIAMRNVGIAYGGATSELEQWIDKMQQSTAYADTEMRDALASLIRITRDVEKAKDLLTLAADVGVGMNRDLTSATTLLMYALSGNWGMLERYIPAIKSAANEEEKWLMLRELFAGQAEEFAKTTAGQMKLLKNNIGDVGEAIGFALLDNLVGVLKKMNETIQSVKEWIGENTELVKGLVIFALALGGILIGLGTFLIFAPGVLAAGTMMGVGFTAMLGPIGLVILAIAAVIAIGVLLIKNWDKIVDFFTGSQRVMTKELKKQLEERTKLQKEAFEKQRADANEAHGKAVEDLRKHYGVLEGYTKDGEKTLMDIARDTSKAREEAIESEIDALERAHKEKMYLLDAEMEALDDAHNQKMRMIDEEYQSKLSALDAETNAAIKALEDELGIMDTEDKATQRSDEDATDNERLRQIQYAIRTAKNIFVQKQAERQLLDFQEEMAEKKQDRDRADKRQSIRSQIAALREQAVNQKEALQAEHDAKMEQEQALFNATRERFDKEKEALDVTLQTKLEHLQEEKEGLDKALAAELIRLEEERQAYEEAESAKLAKLKESLMQQEELLQSFHDREMARLELRAKGIEPKLVGEEEKSGWQKIVDFMNEPLVMAAAPMLAPTSFAAKKFSSFQGFEGTIPGIPGTPIPAIVHAGEYIGQGGGNTVNIYNPSVRSDNDITEITRQVSREMLRMQQMRMSYG